MDARRDHRLRGVRRDVVVRQSALCGRVPPVCCFGGNSVAGRAVRRKPQVTESRCQDTSRGFISNILQVTWISTWNANLASSPTPRSSAPEQNASEFALITTLTARAFILFLDFPCACPLSACGFVLSHSTQHILSRRRNPPNLHTSPNFCTRRDTFYEQPSVLDIPRLAGSGLQRIYLCFMRFRYAVPTCSLNWTWVGSIAVSA